jgi:hypothetical protein
VSRSLRPAFSSAQVASCSDRPIYDEAAVSELFESIKPPPNADGKLADVVAALHGITSDYAFKLWLEHQPSASAEAVQAQKLLKACSDVLRIVGSEDSAPTSENLLPLFSRGGLYAAASIREKASGEEATLTALRGVLQLKRYASDLVTITARREANRQVSDVRPSDKIPLARLGKNAANLEAEALAKVWQRLPDEDKFGREGGE